MWQNLIKKTVTIVAMLVIIVSTINFLIQVQHVASPRSVIYDRSFTAAMMDIVHDVPEQEVIVVSTNAPYIVYFTDRKARVPFTASSKESLVNYMVRNNYQYLLVFEGRSQVKQLDKLFSAEGVKALEDGFYLVRTYQTDFSKIHLYLLKNTQ